jgi:hypothetical protein
MLRIEARKSYSSEGEVMSEIFGLLLFSAAHFGEAQHRAQQDRT